MSENKDKSGSILAPIDNVDKLNKYKGNIHQREHILNRANVNVSVSNAYYKKLDFPYPPNSI